MYTVITVKETERRKPERIRKMKKSFVFVYSDGTEEVVEYDSSMYTEDDVRTIYSNMDKFYSSIAVSN